MQTITAQAVTSVVVVLGAIHVDAIHKILAIADPIAYVLYVATC
jgi:hypothetical protein